MDQGKCVTVVTPDKVDQVKKQAQALGVIAKTLEQFEKISWYWNAANTYIRASIADNPAARIYRYEDLFLGEDRAKHFGQLLEFVAESDSGYQAEFELDAALLDKPLHRTSKNLHESFFAPPRYACSVLTNAYLCSLQSGRVNELFALLDKKVLPTF